MAKNKKGSGFQSGAGLIRYFDSEDEMALKVPPLAVVAMCIIAIFFVEFAKYFWPVG